MISPDGNLSPEFNETRPQQIALATLAAALALLGLWTLHDFLPALVWACIIAIAIWPLYRRAVTRFPPRRHNLLMPSLFTLGIALLFLLPLALVAVQLAREAHGLIRWIDDMRSSGIPAPGWLARLPIGAGSASAWWANNLGNPGSASDLLHQVGRSNLLSATRLYGAQLLHRVLLFGFTLLTLFFLLRDGDRLAAQMRRASGRAFGPAGERIAARMVATVHGTVDGLVLVGLGEGLVLGIVYALTGVPHPTTFGVLTALSAMIPFGAAVMFGIAALTLLANSTVIAAVVVLAAGLLVTFAADHFIRPVLIGGATRLPFLWVLLGILGGVAVWGLLGLFFGPALMSALMLLWREWVRD
ncbi:MAG TPA: AI-2E family transporter [Acetobacteraceae bacterium]|jgi:predicted PurR-regulated permease PerM